MPSLRLLTMFHVEPQAPSHTDNQNRRFEGILKKWPNVAICGTKWNSPDL
jgi:hypothetical protein